MKFLRKINLEINKDLYNPIQVKQNDTARYLLFNLLDNGVPFSLENKTVRVYGVKPDGTKVFNNLTIVNAQGGLAELQLTSQMLAKSGWLKLELVIYEATDILSTIKFDIDVIASLREDAAIESTNEFSALTLGLSKLDEWDKYFKETSGAIEEKYTERLNGIASSLEKTKIQVDTKVTKVEGKGLSTHDYNHKDKIEVSKISGKAEKTELNAINERISNIISHNEDVSGNSELIDIRTDITGKIHGSAGDAIRDQITTLNNNTESLSNSIFEENIVEWDNTRIIDQNGEYVNKSPNDFYITSPIELNNENVINLTGEIQYGNNLDYVKTLNFYKDLPIQHSNLISQSHPFGATQGGSYTYNNEVIKCPSDAKYVILCIYKSSYENLIIKQKIANDKIDKINPIEEKIKPLDNIGKLENLIKNNILDEFTNNDGTFSPSKTYKVSKSIAVEPSTKYYFKNCTKDIYINAYNKNREWQERFRVSANTNYYVTGKQEYYVDICCSNEDVEGQVFGRYETDKYVPYETPLMWDLKDNIFTKNIIDEVMKKIPSINTTEPTATVIFDDGWKEDYTVMYPYLKEKGIVACTAIVTSYQEKYPQQYMSVDQIKELESNGWEIMSHTHNHIDLSTLSKEEQKTEFATSKEKLESYGCQVENIVYPKNHYNHDTMLTVKEYYKSAFAFNDGINYINNIQLNQYAIYRIALEEPLAWNKKHIDKAFIENAWVVFMGHGMYYNPTMHPDDSKWPGKWDANLQNAKDNIEYCIAKGFKIKTARDALKMFGNN
ncbi:polysaccharide deacetylase family protein [Clostridium paraputrificum]|uniref:polysaccharide deacetylase family protein n=1 Tax=Clostridium paraputrificum TaxID=29363 RepID=UPI003F60CED9